MNHQHRALPSDTKLPRGPPDSASQHPSSSSSSLKLCSVSSYDSSSTAHSAFRTPSPTTNSKAKFTAARRKYFTILIGGTLAVTTMIFTILPIYWGSLWKIPAHPLKGWAVDFDGGSIGRADVDSLASQSSPSAPKITWEVIPASQFPQGISQLEEAVVDEKTWVAIAITKDASAGLSSTLAAPDAAYDGSSAITVLSVEARNENAFRNIIRPTVQASLGSITKIYNTQAAQRLPSTANVSALLQTSPQILVQPVGYTIRNLVPASALTFVGIVYQLVLALFVIVIGSNARQTPRYEEYHSFGALVRLRLLSSIGAFFFISLLYSLVSLAFQVDFTSEFGHAGFFIFWMINFVGMLALGLALESMMTPLTPAFLPFFHLLWIISNAAVAVYPLDAMPGIFHYGYAAPFYHISHAVRTVLFGTHNRLGLNFVVLFEWIAVSCVTLPLFQWLRWRKNHHSIRSTAKDMLED